MRWVLAALVTTALLAGSALGAEAEKGQKKREGHKRPTAEAVFKKLDANGDGKIVLDEFLKGRRAQQNPDRAKAFFKRLAGDDEAITLEELKTAFEKMRRRQAERGRGHGGKKPGGEGQK